MSPAQLSAASSLRQLVDKWLAPTASVPARVTHIGRMLHEGHRYIRVETAHATGTLAIFFFRHNDGSWCVFPPTATRPAMSRLAA